MEKVTYIVPIYKTDDESVEYLKKSLNSLVLMMGSEEYNVIFAGTDEVIAKLKSVISDCVNDDKVSYTNGYKSTNDETDALSVINYAINLVTSEYFCVLEFDDEFMPTAYKNFLKYSEAEPDASVYMNINILLDAKNDFNAIGFTNEIVWASSFADEYGYVDKEGLEAYADFNVTGAFINTEDFISVGRLKPSFGIVSWYEFLLRLTFNDKKVYVIPKIGYKHTVGRKDSLMETIANNKELSAKVPKLIELAKTECEYREERELDLENNDKSNTEV